MQVKLYAGHLILKNFDIRYTVCIPETFQIRIKKKFSLKKNIMSHCLGFGRFVYDCSVLYVQLIVFVQFVYEQF